MLAEALQGTGLAGAPLEYFNRDYEESFLSKWGAPDGLDLLAYVKLARQKTASPGDVFGAKLHWYQFVDLGGRIRLVQGYEALDSPSLLEAVFPGVRYVWLSRDDKLRQAISYHKALQTRVWWRIDGITDPRSFPGRVPSYDFEEIQRLEQLLKDHDACWESYFRNARIEPLVLTYEGLLQEYEMSVRSVLSFLGVAHASQIRVPSPRLKRQADLVSEEWSQCYLAERQSRVSVSPELYESSLAGNDTEDGSNRSRGRLLGT
jgi:LPS sulfotransferase NodH